MSLPGFTVYGSESSYFTGKLESYLRYEEIPYRFVAISDAVNDRIRRHVGVFQIPAIELDDGRWLTDSTPIIAWFDAHHARWPVTPAEPVARFLSLLVEDFADEWLWRPAMHYRWSYAPDRFHRGIRLATEMGAGARGRTPPLAAARRAVAQRQLGTFVRGDGVDETTRRHVDDAYLRVLDRLQPILAERPHLLGERPSLVDIAFMGPMFRHFALDPTPARLMVERAPAVWEWVARTWNARGSTLGERPLLDVVPDDWDPLLAESGATHLEQLDANARAHAAGAATHDLTVQGVTYRDLPTSPYRVWCLERLRHAYEALDEPSATTVRARLESVGAWEPLWRTTQTASGHDPEGTAPFCTGSRVIPDELTIGRSALHRRRWPGRRR
ncbi:MAG: glutathione S-transferase family protein [Acidimicrobiales bacterium]